MEGIDPPVQREIGKERYHGQEGKNQQKFLVGPHLSGADALSLHTHTSCLSVKKITVFLQPDQSVLDYLLDYNSIITNRKSNAQCDFVCYFGQKYPYWDEIKTKKHGNADGNSHH